MLLWVPKHARANTELTVLCLENVVIDTTHTSLPEGIIVGQLIEAYGNIAESRVHLHYRITARQAENLGMRPTQTSQSERIVLNALRYTQALIIGMNYKAGSRNIMLVTPSLDVTEADKRVSIQRQHRLALAHLFCDVFMGALGNTRTALASRFTNGFYDGINILLVLRISHKHPYVLALYIFHLLDVSNYIIMCSLLFQFWEEITNYCASHFFVRIFGKHHENGIVTRYCAEEEGMLYVVYIIGNHAGMTWRCMHHH